MRAIFFDLDGTLVNHELAEQPAAALFYQRHSSSVREASVKAFVRTWQSASEWYMEQYLKGQITFQEQSRRRIREVVLQPVTPEEADTLFADYLEAYELSWRVFPDVHEVLAVLRTRGLPMDVISNGHAEQQSRKRKNIDLLQFFKHVLVSGDVGVAKPDPAIFQMAADLMGCSSTECIHVEDSFTLDVRGALGAGMRAVWLDRSGQEEPKEGADSYTHIRNLRELVELIQSKLI